MIARLAVAASLAMALASGAACASSAKAEVRQQWDFGIEMARRSAWKEALFRFRRSVELDPDNALLRNNLAVAYESLGDYRGAAREYERALELDPKNERIRTNFDSFQTFYGGLLERDDASRPQTAPDAAVRQPR